MAKGGSRRAARDRSEVREPAAFPLISRPDPRAADRKLVAGSWLVFTVIWGATLLIEVWLQANLLGLQFALTGITLLGLNVARYLRGISMSRLTLMIGLAALVGGSLRQATGEFTVLEAVLTTIFAALVVEGIGRWLPPRSSPRSRRAPR